MTRTYVPDITFQSIYERLLLQIPAWFGNQQFQPIPFNDTGGSANVFNTMMWSFIISAYQNYSQLRYDWLQERIGAYEIDKDPNWPENQTNPLYPIATENNLDIISTDFFGNALPRRPTESDDNYRTRILASVVQVKASRQGMIERLTSLVAPAFEQAEIPVIPPTIYEGWSAIDNGGGLNDYNPPVLALNRIGSFGTGSQPYTCWITVYLPSQQGLGGYTGLSNQVAADAHTITWGVGIGDPSITPATPPADVPPTWYGSDSLLNIFITQSDILNVINLAKVLGTLCILNPIVYVT